MFARFKFEPKIYKMVEDKPDLDAPIPADPVVPIEPKAIDPLELEIPPLPPRRKAGAA